VVTLTEFLTARLDEDEARGRLWSETWRSEGGVIDLVLTPGPARVLAEVAAKRRIVELAKEATRMDQAGDVEYGAGQAPRDESVEPYLGTLILRALAAPYADHPDFNEDWRGPAITREGSS